MTRDLHSAILFCAFLSSKPVSNNHLQASVCANARPILSTLFQTTKERKKQRSQRLFKPSLRTNDHVKTSQPGFFDPSYIPHDYQMKYAIKSLKRAANFNPNSPTFLHPRVKSECILQCFLYALISVQQNSTGTHALIGLKGLMLSIATASRDQ
jgi:hypothetical protein